jgi:hypothetical protein
MRASPELLAVLKRAIDLALAEGSPSVGLRHLGQALVDPRFPSSRAAAGSHVPSSRAARTACDAACVLATRQGAGVAGTRHLVEVLAQVSSNVLGQAVYESIQLIDIAGLTDSPPPVEADPHYRRVTTTSRQGHAVVRRRSTG